MILRLENVSKAYLQGTKKIEVLNALNMEVKEGEIVSIVGQSGCGKSTLLSLISGLDTPDSGKVILNGKDLSLLSETEVTRLRGESLGIVFQQFHLIPHLSAWENVHLPLEILGAPNEKKASEMLAKVGLSRRGDHFPDQLSGGECQRVAIARAMIADPSLILADEPSGNLDATTSDQVMGVLFDMVKSEKCTMVLVTHNEKLAAVCQRQLTLKNGVLV
ncbi:MAG: ABC transporter ATP-binding protein [Proteobacteria bacterium SG_bin7]|nr:MAG: ABC transporter ATP-binding protein [Proteobacteria bacterium SG_bin7]